MILEASSTSVLPQMQVTPKQWRRQSSRVFLVINGAGIEPPEGSLYSLQEPTAETLENPLNGQVCYPFGQASKNPN